MAEPTRITRPDGTVLELIETIPAASADARRPSRTKARKQALDLLYAADLRQQDAAELLAEASEEGEVRPLTVELLEAVAAHAAEIDALLVASLAPGWTLDRMPRVDRCLARLALAEVLAGAGPAQVAVEQAVALAGELSTDESAEFLNGLLAAALQRRAARTPTE